MNLPSEHPLCPPTLYHPPPHFQLTGKRCEQTLEVSWLQSRRWCCFCTHIPQRNNQTRIFCTKFQWFWSENRLIVYKPGKMLSYRNLCPHFWRPQTSGDNFLSWKSSHFYLSCNVFVVYFLLWEVNKITSWNCTIVTRSKSFIVKNLFKYLGGGWVVVSP